MKKYSDDDNTRTDVNGAWKTLKPLQEGFEFVGDDQYDNFLTKKSRERRKLKKDLRDSGSSRKDARKEARNRIPTNKPARRGAYLSLVKLNYRGYAIKLNAIITGTNTKILNDLKDKWRKWGDWSQLIDAVNKGKDKKPLICGAKCRKEVLDFKMNNFEPLSSTAITALITSAGVVIASLAGILKQAQIGKQQRDAIEGAERAGENDFNNLPIEEKQAILKAEQELRNQANSSNNKKYIFIGVGLVALIGIIYIIRKNK
jgi:hypothetical protein